jgi:hypothetical protein
MAKIGVFKSNNINDTKLVLVWFKLQIESFKAIFKITKSIFNNIFILNNAIEDKIFLVE